MAQKVVLIGHCGPDSSYLRMAVASALPGAQVTSADDESELRRAIDAGADLLLLNRLLDYGFKENEGTELIARLRQSHPGLKMMLVSNYDDAQQAAVAAGALPGFGKRDIGSPKVKQRLRDALAPATSE
jgi:two-component system, chemotaxis family, chemotaxis protein CheY